MNEPTDSMHVEFIRCNAWANTRLLEACEALSLEQLAASAPGAYGTIARTLEHLVDTASFCLLPLTGRPLPPPFRWDEKPPVPTIRTYYDDVARDARQRGASEMAGRHGFI